MRAVLYDGQRVGGAREQRGAPSYARFSVHLWFSPWWGKASPEFRVLAIYTAPNAFFFVHTAFSRRVVVGIAWESVRTARDNDAFRNLGRWDWSNRVNCGRCRAYCALVEGYDTRARPFTRSEGRLRVPGQETTIGARATGGFEFWVGSWRSQPRNLVRGRVSLKSTLALSAI